MKATNDKKNPTPLRSRPLSSWAPTSWTVLAWAIVTAVASAIPVLAQDGVTEIEVGCNDQGTRCREVFAAFEFPDDGVEGYLELFFEEATSLGPESFDITARMVDPDDPELATRLPRDTFIPDDFPVLVTIEPQRGGALSFRRNWTLELVTENLEFSSHTPYRLLRAPTGGAFQDISFSLGSGSFRVRGAGGRFSEFLIVADLRTLERVVTGKLGRLRAALVARADEISTVIDDLTQLVDQTQQALEEDQLPEAVRSLEQFIRFVEERSGTDIPDGTAPGDGGAAAVSALLLSSAQTLQHTIFLGLESAQGGMSGFSTRLKVGEHDVRIDLEFEDAFVIDPEDLEIMGEPIDVNSSAIRDRLPEGVHVPEEFPVLIRINPKAGVSQAFNGIFEIELQTDSLRFLGGTPLRLFKAPDGGAFEDITRTYGLGSFRVRGAGGRFSEFLVVEDMRPVEAVVSGKFQDVDQVVADNADELPAALRRELRNAIAQIQQSVGQGDLGQAIEGIETLIVTIEDNSGEGIPALWRSGEGSINVAGELISALESLIFSLELQDEPPVADPGDVNLDGEVDVGDIFFLIDQVFGDSPPPAEFFFPSRTDDEP